MTKLHTFLVIALTAAGCAADGDPVGASGDLVRDDVENLPAGDASGSAASGTWRVSIRTTSCTSACTAQQCTVAETSNAQFPIIQANGALTMDAFTRLRGGLDSDGSFVVGGVAMQGATEQIGRLSGTLTGGSMVGTVVVRVRGANDCTAVGDVAGTKL